MNLSSNDAEELLRTAFTLMAQHKPAEALKCLKRVEQIQPGSALALYLKGVIQMQAGALEPALELMLQAVKADPNLYAAHFHIGLLLFNEDRDEEAAQAWQKLESLGEEHGLVLFTRGIHAWSRDDFAACRRYLLRGLELNVAQGLFNAQMRQLLAWADEEEKERRGEDEEEDANPAKAEKSSVQARKGLKLPGTELKARSRPGQETVSLSSRVARSK